MKAPALQPLPAGIACAADYAAHARAALPDAAWQYFAAHAGDGVTARANRAAWDRIALLPRVLRGVRSIELSTTLLGQALPWPLLVAPMALQRLAHPDGEAAMALAASAQGAGLVLGSEASLAIESVGSVFGPAAQRGPFWFQLYLLPDRGQTLALLRRAEAAGCQALVLTVDAGVRAARPLQLPPEIAAVNLPAATPAPSGSLQELLARSARWDDVAWLRSQTRLPLLLKGVLHPADAREALQHGVDGLIVSNHGGRVLDGAAATADALPAIAAVAGDLPLLVDGGIERGTDVLKALALGARAVLLGRPALWGLAAAGAAGAAHVLRLIRDELQLAMAQCGAASVAEIGPGLLRP